MAQQSVLPGDELARKREAIRTLARGLVMALGLGEVAIIIVWLLNPQFPFLSQTLIIVATASIGVVSYFLANAGKVKVAGYLFIFGLLIDSAIITPFFGGFSGPMAITYLFSIIAAGIVINLNASFVVATVAAVIYLAVVVLEKSGVIPQMVSESERATVIPNITAVVLLVFFYLTAFLSWFAASRLNRALQEVRRNATELQAANEKLQASEEELRASNEELEAANEELKATEEELRASNEELHATNEELKGAQEKLIRSEKLAAIGQLAGGVGHELRNPLGAIKNAVYYIRGKMVNSELAQKEPRVMQFLDIVDGEIASSTKIISDLLTFSRVGKPAVSPARIEKVIDDAVAHSVIPKNIELTRSVATGLPEIQIDSDQVRQVLVNMITNAVQAMPEGGKLAIAAQQKEKFLEMKVTDTGAGIPEDARGKLFEPLYTTKAKGIGLGLAVCKAIVDRHGGHIDVDSTLGKGTSFTIRLPLKA